MWKKVAWSDESAIKKDSDTRTVWVWRHTEKAGKVEKYLPKNVVGKRQDGGISQMIWGCFVGNKLGPIVFIDENINRGSQICSGNGYSIVDQIKINPLECRKLVIISGLT